MSELTTLLEMLSCSDNNIRSEAEVRMKEEWSSRPQIFIHSLTSLVVNPSTQTTISTFAAILLRREISKNHSLPCETRNSICPSLLETFASTYTNVSLRKKIGDVIAEIACQTEGTFTLLLDVVRRILIESRDLSLISSSLTLISSSPTTFLSSSEVITSLTSYLTKEETLLSAFKASINLMMNATSDVLLPLANTFIPIYPSLVNISIQASDDGFLLSSLMEEMLELLAWEYENDCLVQYFSQENWIPSMFQACMSSLIKEDISNESKEMVLETLTSFIEVIPSLFVASKRRLKSGNVVLQNYLDCLINLIANSLSIEDDKPLYSEWYCSEAVSANEEDGGSGGSDALTDYSESLSQFAEGMLDRISITLIGNNTIISWMHRTIPIFYLSPDWRMRWAALRSLASMAEGANEGMVRGGDGGLEGTLLYAVLSNIIWPSFQDQHPRVQYAACHALGQLCSDFGGLIQSKWAKESLDAIGSLHLTTIHPRLQSHSSAALINFSDDSTDAIPLLTSALPQLLERSISLLMDDKSPSYLREQILATLSSLQSCCPSSFKGNASSLMDVYLSILLGMSNKKNITFCRCLEAATVLLEVVDAWKDLSPSRHLDSLITKVMVPIQESLIKGTIEDDYHSDIEEYLSSAWIRVANSLNGGGDASGNSPFSISPYLPLIIPHLIKVASQDADLAIIEASPGSLDPEAERKSKEEELKSSCGGWEFESSSSGKRIGINTTALESKEAAIESLHIWITSLDKKDWVPLYYDSLLDTLLPLCNFLLHVGVQQAAIQCMVSIIRETNNEYQSTPQMIDILLSSMEEDPESLESWEYSLLNTFIDAISHLITLSLKVEGGASASGEMEDILCLPRPTTRIYSSILNPNIIERSSRIIDHCTTIIKKENAKMLKKFKKKDDDEEDFLSDDAMDGDEASSLSYSMGRLFLAIMKLASPSPLTVVERNIKFWEFIGESSTMMEGTSSFQHSSICHIDDLLLNFGTTLYEGYSNNLSFCVNFVPFLHKALMCGVTSSDENIRQASIYGIGVSSLGGKGNKVWIEFIEPIFPHLISFVDCADSRSIEMVKCTENAMSAIVRICLSFPECKVASLTLRDVLPRWISGLPVHNDDDESPLIYAFLVNAFRIDGGSLVPVLIGQNGEYGSLLLKSLLDSLSRNPGILGNSYKMLDMGGNSSNNIVPLRSQVKQLALALKDRLPCQDVQNAISGFSEQQLLALN